MEFTDESALATNPISKRRIMEVQGGGGEVRRIHIIYYLCRKGRIEHPHLIRVHHLSRNGVHLRDVKRWLSELRGKDTADSFAWSFKRRYKKGFLWQDLVDEDLITPISDNEYVLKGSEISSTTFTNDLSPYGEEKEVIIQKEPPLIHQIDSKTSTKEETKENPQVLMDDSTQRMSEIDESPPLYSTQTSTVTEDSIKLEEHEDTDSPIEKKQEQEDEDEEEEKGKFGNDSICVNNSNASIRGKSAPTFTKSKSRSSGKSSRLRSLISCRGVDTMDSATVKINKYSKISTTLSNNTMEICDFKTGMCQMNREQINGGRKSWKRVKDPKKNGYDERRSVYAAYRPIYGPNCSQCGKEFKPEKLYKHMKSCRGMKAFAKSDKTPQVITTSIDSPNQDSDSSYYYLTHK